MVSANAILIDDFSDPANQTNVSVKQKQQAWDNVTSTVIGGIRNGSVGCESSTSDGTTTAKFSNGRLEVYTNKKASPSIYLGYDGTAGWGANLDTDPFNGTISPVLDFTADGSNDRFSITFASAGGMDSSTNFFNDVLLSVKIEGEETLYQKDVDDAANAWMDENYDILAAGSAAAFEIDFSDLGVSIDMTKVEAFSLHICSENMNMDYSIDTIEAVPEPAVLTLVALFGIGLLSAKRLFNR